jgi:hypothetical protein
MLKQSTRRATNVAQQGLARSARLRKATAMLGRYAPKIADQVQAGRLVCT